MARSDWFKTDRALRAIIFPSFYLGCGKAVRMIIPLTYWEIVGPVMLWIEGSARHSMRQRYLLYADQGPGERQILPHIQLHTGGSHPSALQAPVARPLVTRFYIILTILPVVLTRS